MTAVQDKPKAPKFDFAALTAEDAKLPAGSRGSVLDGTPFVAWMKESRAQQKAKAVTVPTAVEGRTAYMIRKAAEVVGCGVRIVAADPVNGSVKITFEAKDKKRKLTDEERAQRKAEVERKRAERVAAKAAKASASK